MLPSTSQNVFLPKTQAPQVSVGGCTERGALVPPRHRHLPEATTAQPRSPWGEHTA